MAMAHTPTPPPAQSRAQAHAQAHAQSHAQAHAQPASILDRSGVIIVDKPSGMSSHDVVARLRRIMGTRRVGHSGTLDPMATGVLVIGVERGTKFLAHVVTHDKRYEATMRLGATTVTDDAEGDVLSTAAPELLGSLDDDSIRAACAAFVGDIQQKPTSVSSIKINGRRAHELVREGQEVDIPARPVTVHSLKVHPITRIGGAAADGSGGTNTTNGANTTEAPEAIDVVISVHCSSGTYIRAIARDVGAELGVGGHLTQLRRTSVGPFDIAEAKTLEQLAEDPQLSLSLDDAMIRCFPTREITEEQATNVALGKWLEPVGKRGVYAVVTPTGHAYALLKEKGARAASVFVARPHGLD
ncbi:tRNA pseudouridine(55) synthase TruB [Corynebacterium falsenii]|uniref:tRNA pseudouridine(55) synthase TruB n=1 Tax=Corynebacterium falsenii TaxID=108486 RepID=UPI003FCEEE81